MTQPYVEEKAYNAALTRIAELEADLSEAATVCRMVQEERDDLRAKLAASEALVLVVTGLQAEMDAAVQANEDRHRGGQQVPFHGDFAAAMAMPSILNRFRWWSKRITEALAKAMKEGR